MMNLQKSLVKTLRNVANNPVDKNLIIRQEAMKKLVLTLAILIYIVTGCTNRHPRDAAIDTVLLQEGKFANHPADGGGATNYGISLRLLKSLGMDIDMDGDVDIHDIMLVDEGIAREIYRNEWWEKYHYDNIKNPAIATMILSLSVNIGAKNCHKIIQKSINEVFVDANIPVDGNLGARTLWHLDIANDEDDIGKSVERQIRMAVSKNAILYYESLVMKNRNLAVFLQGWKNRVAFITKVR